VTLNKAGGERELRVEHLDGERWRVSSEPDLDRIFGLKPAGGDDWHVDDDGHRTSVRVIRYPHGITIFLDGQAHDFEVPAQTYDSDEDAGAGDGVAAPMPGVVRQILRETGAAVSKGDGLIVIEAMKMEMTLAAPRDGIVAEIRVEEGAQVSEGTTLMTLEKEGAAD
jgi:3-methylcrotonyl-CoA carboxylase alpha subunit